MKTIKTHELFPAFSFRSEKVMLCLCPEAFVIGRWHAEALQVMMWFLCKIQEFQAHLPLPIPLTAGLELPSHSTKSFWICTSSFVRCDN